MTDSDRPAPPRTPQPAEFQPFPRQPDGELLINGVPLSRLAARVGRTPFYAYDRSRLQTRIAELRAALPAAVKIHYAIKANPMPALVCEMARLADGLDVASQGELKLALDAGMRPDAISFAGPGKRDEELLAALAAGVTIHIESPRELMLLAALGERHGWTPRVALRINPDFELKSAGMKMGGGPKPFGVDAETAPALLREIGRLGLAFEGLHLFCGSQNLKAEAIVEAQQASYALAVQLAEHAPGPIRTLNLGGGFGIPYFPGEKRLSLAPIAANLQALVERAATELPGSTLVLELGRYLVGEAGVYVFRVTDRKMSRGQVFLVCDGGLHQHLSASGNFGQVIRKNYPLELGTRAQPAEASGDALETVMVVGPLCTPLDLLGDRVQLPPAASGDLLVLYQSGAYGASASPQAFLGHPPLTEVLV